MMLLTSTLPLLPPPSSSLLPSLTQPPGDPSVPAQPHSHDHQHPSRRQKHSQHLSSRNNALLALSVDERTIAQRKMVIAMYGYSWLKPAGCSKTMLGRREEEIEREEVDRQLRDLDLQERHAAEAEEQDRIAQARELGEPEEGRDLDEDIPDADAAEEEDGDSFDEDGSVEEGNDEDAIAMGGDLDDEIPDADDQDEDDDGDELLSPAGADGLWVYDTRREPDTDDEDQLPAQLAPARHGGTANARHAAATAMHSNAPRSEYDYDEREAEDLTDAMFDDDEMFSDHRVSHSTRHSLPRDRDLDDEVPDADEAWEHTDTELEESEMDISILPDQNPMQHGRSSIASTMQRQQNQRNSTRTATAPRSSGPWIAEQSPMASPPHLPAPIQAPTQNIMPRQRGTTTMTPDTDAPSSASQLRTSSMRAARIVSGNRQRPYHPDRARAPARHQLRQMHTQTLEMVDTPPLAATIVDQQEEEELDTDIEEDELDGDIDVTTPDPFVAPEHARALGLGLPQVGRLPVQAQARGNEGTNGPPTRGVQGREEDRNDRINTTASPNRTTAARNWLDGAAAVIGVGGARDTPTATATGPRRTLFQRATRRRDADVPGQGTAVSATTAETLTNPAGSGNSSGGLFSSPDLGSVRGAHAGGSGNTGAGGAWDTPEGENAGDPQPPELGRRVGGRRSGRFLGGRRRGAGAES